MFNLPGCIPNQPTVRFTSGPLSFHATLQGLLRDPPEKPTLDELVGTGGFFMEKSRMSQEMVPVPKKRYSNWYIVLEKNMVIDPKRQVNINRNASLVVLKLSGANSRSEHHAVFGKLTVSALPQNRPFKPEVLPNKKNLPEHEENGEKRTLFSMQTVWDSYTWLIDSFIHPFIPSFLHSWIPSFLHSFIHSFIARLFFDDNSGIPWQQI